MADPAPPAVLLLERIVARAQIELGILDAILKEARECLEDVKRLQLTLPPVTPTSLASEETSPSE